MVTKRISQHDAGPLPLDEAWWAALLLMKMDTI